MDKEVIWLHGEVRTPPFSEAARIETGVYLRQLQQRVLLSMRTRVLCRASARDAMNFAYLTQPTPGVSFIALTTSQLLLPKYLLKKTGDAAGSYQELQKALRSL